jgi:hypothetical protein
MAAGFRVDTREWNKTFDLYVQLRRKSREDMIIHKAAGFAYEAYKALPATDPARIAGELSKNNLLLKLAVVRLKKQGVSLKGRALTKTGKKKRQRKGGRRPLTPGNLLVKAEANKILKARRRSSGYHRIAFLIASQKLKGQSLTNFNPRSFLAKTQTRTRNGQNNTIVSILAVARGLDCPSTKTATAAALQAVQADMQVYIDRKLREAKEKSGFLSRGGARAPSTSLSGSLFGALFP